MASLLPLPLYPVLLYLDFSVPFDPVTVMHRFDLSSIGLEGLRGAGFGERDEE